MAKKNILILTTTLNCGGAEKMVYELARGLDQNRFSVTVASLLGRGHFGKKLEAAGIPVLYCEMHGYADVSVFPKLARIIKEKNVQVIHSFLFHANIIGRLLRFRFPRLEAISSIRTMEQGASWHLLVDRLTKPLVSFEIANCDAVRAFTIARTRSDPEKIRTIYNGVVCGDDTASQDDVRRRFALPRDVRIVGAVGSLEPAKDHATCVEMVYHLVHLRDDVHCVIAGEGSLRVQLEQLIRTRDLSTRITVLGFCHDVPALMRAFDVCVLTSQWEGFPNVVLEACAARIPVVATDVGGVREIVPRPDVQLTGIADAKGLSEKVNYVLDNAAVAEKISAEAYARVTDLFSLPVMCARTQEVYDQLLSN